MSKQDEFNKKQCLRLLKVKHFKPHLFEKMYNKMSDKDILYRFCLSEVSLYLAISIIYGEEAGEELYNSKIESNKTIAHLNK